MKKTNLGSALANEDSEKMVLGFMLDDREGFNNFNKKIPLFADICKKAKFQSYVTPLQFQYGDKSCKEDLAKVVGAVTTGERDYVEKLLASCPNLKWVHCI